MSSKTSTTSKTATKTEDEPKIINVDRDFKGNLENAIAAAQDGDLVQLGNDTYHTEGIRLNKDITIDGQKGSVIDGGGTSESIFYLTAGASGATIQDVEITNGNNGIFGEGVSNLTLQNLAFNLESIPSDAKTATKTEDETKIINVDRDFKGNLENAIAAAKNGDLVQLGNDTYYTKGIRLNKDITIDGQKGSVIDGGGTSESIFYLTAGASGATIQDVEITNGNNGIFAEGASNLTLQNLDINNIGINQTIRNGPNNTGIILSYAEGLQLLDSKIHNIGRKAVGIENTDGGIVSGLSIEDVNLRAQHAQSHDAAGIKFFNTNDITVKDSYFSDINGISIWNDTNNSTTIENNLIENVGEDFLAPTFNQQVDIFGIYDEKSYNSVIKNNEATAIDDFSAFRVTEFSGETITLEDNNFSSSKLGTTDYWVNELAEKLVALTEDPDQANFSLFAEEYSAYANIGD